MSGRGLRLKFLQSRNGKATKYGAVRTIVDGVSFASKREAVMYAGLKFLEKRGKITDLKLQPRIKLSAGGVHICDYVGDFFFIPREPMYDHAAFEPVYMDVKGFITPVYQLKKKLVLALTGIAIVET